MSTKPKCRNCGKEFKGDASNAYDPKTNERVKWNWYGGWVCSAQCDEQASVELERSMPGGFPFKSLSSFAKTSLKKNWPERYNY